jgi:DNA sulfur modification protein DndB
MLNNVLPVDDLRSLARRKNHPSEFKSVSKSGDSSLVVEDGWQQYREGATTVRLIRPKTRSVLLEDRAWCLLYSLGFTHLSGEGGAQLVLDPKKDDGAYNQIDVVGLDPEVAVAIECKSAEQPRKYSEFQKDLAKHALIRQRFANSVSGQFPAAHKRVSIIVMFTWDLILSDNDIQRAKNENLVLLNEKDLNYYELLASHLGQAAKYQFFADMLPGRRVHGLELRIPALQSRLGKYTCYTFSIAPEYLLKIAYVSHRAKGKATDIDTYQRMIKKSRLKKIREYIDANGIFPTNIVISLEGKRHVNFEPWQKTGEVAGTKHGTLILTPSYRCAWIIDGQHRLFAYSGHKNAKTSHLSVLAFEGLPASKQAQLFIDINHEQKSVKRSLLQELYAELNWDAEDDDKRVNAIVSKAVQALNEDKESPFYERILLADETRTDIRCITLESLFRTLNQPGMFVVKQSVDYGPLWTGENDSTLKRVIQVVNGWFRFVRDAITEWWNLGAATGGGLSMNDGVSVCMTVLRSILQYLLEKKHAKLIHLSNDELLDVLRPYGEALGQHLAGYSEEQRRDFRVGARGNQGQTATRRKCEKALNEKFPDFEPPGLREALKAQEAQTNEQAYRLIVNLEKRLIGFILGTLKLEFGDDQTELWWYSGVPQQIRKKAAERLEDEKGKGKKETYLDLIDLRTIVLNNWTLFQDSMGFGKSGNKEAKTEWMHKLNESRKIVMHGTKQQTVSFEQLAQLREYEKALTEKLTDQDVNSEP